jgi:hypothetical protein
MMGGRRHRRGCAWRVVPSRRFAELVGCLVLGLPADVPDGIADPVVAVAQRTLQLVADGMSPAAAYERALAEREPEWGRRR